MNFNVSIPTENTRKPGLYRGNLSGAVLFFPDEAQPNVGIVVVYAEHSQSPSPVGTVKTNLKSFHDEEAYTPMPAGTEFTFTQD